MSKEEVLIVVHNGLFFFHTVPDTKNYGLESSVFE